MIPEVETALLRLHSRRSEWLKVSTEARIDYLKRCMAGVMEVAEEWAIEACKAKGTESAGEEWLTGAVPTLMMLRAIVRTLEGRSTKIENGIARVFPDHLLDRLLWLGFRGEVWVDRASTVKHDRSAISLVLGAGNVGSTAPLDALHKLFAENQVVLLKMNPVNDYVGKFLEQAFEPLITDGFLQIVYGGTDVGSYLCQHPKIDSIHVTGSHHTYYAIANSCSKPITSELGCVTPVLIVPGNWSESDLKFQARHVASMVVHNASFNCVAAKVIVTAKGWKLRDRFLDLLRQEFAKIPNRKAYYPGAQERYQAFLDRYPQAEIFGTRTQNIVPWTFIPEIQDHYALQTEAFCGVLAEVSLEATSAEEFLDRAVPFCNEKIWGNLSCVILTKTPVEKAIRDLNYGAIGVNVWTGVIYALPDLAWGAYPENEHNDIQSGQGFVHNAYFLDRPLKSVLYAPFRIRPTPFWFADHHNLLQFAKRAAELQISPTWSKFVQVIFAAVRG
ncbi:aldehyde dehydrogenase family protein [Leptolyngbya sp. NIES-2104]|uniref:aldehyde dehydrogenase family protein n=1 Tax=Leptolyngbya sp. NIES-2104 TaxID=1552121 RepID=UPI0006ECBCA1|nr:aldehyde dehydrogenase family protein [Leptolyngbya sp. NIES-2104]GAP99288.1 aldehyde dehydrogenase [Leptolyngbya sp. NIES-2104]